VRTSFSGHHIVERRWGGRGTGAVKAIGSYEGSLSVEGISGCTSHLLSREGGHGDLGGFLARGQRYRSQEPKLHKGVAKALRCSSRALKEATEMSEARSVRWRRGKITPTLGAHAPGNGCGEAKRQHGSACPVTVRRSVRECRETLGPPVIPHGAQDSVGCPRDESRGVSWERTRYGYT